MDGECEQLDLIKIHRGCGRCDEQNRVSLTDALFGPVGERRISDVEDEVDLIFQGVQPVRDRRVIERAAKLKLIVLPGVATMTEAFEALKAGASGLKLFPGEAIPPEVVRAWRSVLPKATPLFPVGGVTPERIGPYQRAGADGFGIGSALYKPGASAEAVAHAAQVFVRAWKEAL